MAAEYKARGQSELKQIRKQSRTLYWFVALFSIFCESTDAHWSALYVAGV